MIIKEILIIILFLLSTKNYLYLFLGIFVILFIFYRSKYIKKEKDHRFIIKLFSSFAQYNQNMKKEEALQKVNEEMLHYQDEICQELKIDYDDPIVEMFCDYLYINSNDNIIDEVKFMIDNDDFYSLHQEVNNALNELLFSGSIMFLCSFCFSHYFDAVISSIFGLIIFFAIILFHVLLILMLFGYISYIRKNQIINTYKLLRMNISEEEALDLLFIIYPSLNKNKYISQKIRNMLVNGKPNTKPNNSFLEIIPALISLLFVIAMIGG
ncbi:MAG: hypothetical protein ACI4U5_00920 [Bacilli bacterium]